MTETLLPSAEEVDEENRLTGIELWRVVTEVFGGARDVRLEQIKKMQKIATTASRFWEGLPPKTFYVIECKECWEVSYIRAGANGIGGVSTWSRKRCVGCDKKLKPETINVIWKVPAA